MRRTMRAEALLMKAGDERDQDEKKVWEKLVELVSGGLEPTEAIYLPGAGESTGWRILRTMKNDKELIENAMNPGDTRQRETSRSKCRISQDGGRN